MLGAPIGTTMGRLGPAAMPGSRPRPRFPWFGSVSCVSLRLLPTLPHGSPPSALFLPASGAPAGPHVLCSSFPVCAPRDSQLNVRGGSQEPPPSAVPAEDALRGRRAG